MYALVCRLHINVCTLLQYAGYMQMYVYNTYTKHTSIRAFVQLSMQRCVCVCVRARARAHAGGNALPEEEV